MSGLLANLACASLTKAAFNSYLTLFIVIYATAFTSLLELSIFSLANITFKISLFGLNARLKVSKVTLVVSVIASYSSYLMTCNIYSQIFTFYNGVLLQKL